MNLKHLSRIVLSAALALCAAGCSEVSYPVSEELAVTARSVVPTKGYVTGAEMWDTPLERMHGGAADTPRGICLTAWHYAHDGTEGEYFRAKDFGYDASLDDGGVHKWRGEPSVYWPFGGRLDFLGYSVSRPFPEGSVRWGAGRSTDELVVDVTRDYTQDDILFGSAIGRRRTDAGTAVVMTFEHAQAWLQFVLRSTEEASGAVTLECVMVEDLYTSGRLTVTHAFGFAEGKWSFLFDTREDVVVDDTHGVFGTEMTFEPKYCDMLIPEQRMRKVADVETHVVLSYRFTGSSVVMQYEYALPAATWQMGRKYVYEIVFNPRGIELVPEVQDLQGVPVDTPIGD